LGLRRRGWELLLLGMSRTGHAESREGESDEQ
jgi:hypothetical protein